MNLNKNQYKWLKNICMLFWFVSVIALFISIGVCVQITTIPLIFRIMFVALCVIMFMLSIGSVIDFEYKEKNADIEKYRKELLEYISSGQLTDRIEHIENAYMMEKLYYTLIKK